MSRHGIAHLGIALPVLLVLGCNTTPLTQEQRQEVFSEAVEGVGREFPDVATVSPEGLERLMAGPEGVVLVDVRSEVERSVSMLPGALTREEFEASFEHLSGRPVVAYCTIGVRSSLFAQEMARRGIEVANLEGSILGWSHHGGLLVRDGAPTRQLHVYGSSWDLAAEGYEAVW